TGGLPAASIKPARTIRMICCFAPAFMSWSPPNGISSCGFWSLASYKYLIAAPSLLFGVEFARAYDGGGSGEVGGSPWRGVSPSGSAPSTRFGGQWDMPQGRMAGDVEGRARADGCAAGPTANHVGSGLQVGHAAAGVSVKRGVRPPRTTA